MKGETQIDGGTISHATTAAFFHPFGADSTRFLSSSAPSLSHGIGCCICGSGQCEIMERASAAINVFFLKIAVAVIGFKTWPEVIVSFIHFVFGFFFILSWKTVWLDASEQKYPISSEHYSNTFIFPCVHIFLLSRLQAMYTLLIDGKISIEARPNFSLCNLQAITLGIIM